VSDAVRASAWGLLEAGLVDLVGSDAHRPNSPSIRLDLLADLIAQRSDRGTAERLLVETPARLLS
jgi:tyrosine-protein phosphatase YwqE